jgi:hypothetical protein
MSEPIQEAPVETRASVFFNRVADLLQGGMFSAKYFEEVIVVINTLRQIGAKELERESAAKAPAAPVAETAPAVSVVVDAEVVPIAPAS